MNAIFRRPWNRLPALAGALVLAAAAATATAGTTLRAVEAMQERQAQRQHERQQQQEDRRVYQQQRQQDRQQQRQQNQQVRQERQQQNQQAREQRQQQNQQQRLQRQQQNQQREQDRRDARAQPRPDRPQADRNRNDPRFANRKPQRQWQTNQGNRDRYRPVPPRRYVPALPHGHTRYNWHGRPYYYSGGSWYRPWGSQFAIVRPPVGLFVSYLPSYHTSFHYGSSRYYFADDIYYLYEPTRRGYVVTRSPYDDDDDDYEEATFDEDELYVYPAQGQSEEQQADDRYECHRWSVGETGYDPVEGNFDPDERAQYLRALGACLTGKGYTVR